MRYAVLLFALFAGMSSNAHAQAFGVKPGDPVAKYQGKVASSPNQFRIVVPQPNSEFDEYLAMATPQTGICAVSGMGRTHDNDSYGSSVRTAFNDLREALNDKYGTSKDYDFLKAGSIWKDSNEFGWSLYKEERTLTSFWGPGEGSSNLGSIGGIMLDARAVSPTGTYVALRYEFDNFPACKAAMATKDNAGL